jgi:predicted DNA binding CopG/RHH family protein
MKETYDFSKMKARRNPYINKLKKPVTIRLGVDIVAYFKNMAQLMGVPYQNLINLYLNDCVRTHRKIHWSTH